MQPTLSQWLSRRPAGPKPKKPMKRGGRVRTMSAKRRRQAKAYSLLRAAFLKAHPRCQALPVILMAGHQVPVVKGDVIKSTDVHHKAGRHGWNYLNTDTWLAVCRPAHRWIHDNPKEARALGLMD